MLSTKNTPYGLSLLLWIAVAGCGEGHFVVSNDSYEPRIVIEGFLRPGSGVDRIHIWRNFPPDVGLREVDLIPDDTRAKIIDEDSGKEYPLSFHGGNALRDFYFQYVGDDLVIEHGKSYTLDVRATVEGQALHAWATTTVPKQGFEIVSVRPDTRLPYRPLGENGKVINIELLFERSPGITLYAFTTRPLEAKGHNFVYDNPFEEKSRAEVEANIFDYMYRINGIQNTPVTAGQSKIEIFWFLLWFYSRYEIIVYAADENYQHFLQTFDETQEEDGNFHEPLFEIEGDGIGVFGAVIADTVYVDVLRE